MVLTITDMDVIRSALLNALASGVDLEAVVHATVNAETARDFDAAICLLCLAEPQSSQRSVIATLD